VTTFYYRQFVHRSSDGLTPGEWAIIDEALAGRITWAQAKARLVGVKPWFEFYDTDAYTEAAWRQYIGPPPAWHEGASTDEVLGFRLVPGYADGIRTMDDAELLDRLARTVERSQQPGGKTRWLVRYTGLLLDERLRRRGVG
jgi:hypothetical protein